MAARAGSRRAGTRRTSWSERYHRELPRRPGPRAAKMAVMPAFELLITGGTIVDGTGALRFEGAVGLTRRPGGEAVLTVLRGPASIDEAKTQAGRVIDATGKVVAPGFI